MEIKQVPAHPSNYSKNTGANQLRKIVLHWIVGELSAADAVFKKPNSSASAHYGIGSDGAVNQYVADRNIAWHAGPKVNYESIGIEHAGGQLIDGLRKKPTAKCHETSAELVAMLSKKYGIPLDRNHIRKHNEYMATQCPGSLDIDFIIMRAKEINNPQPLDYELYQKNGHVYAHFKSGLHNGQYVMKDKVTGETTDTGNIFMSQGTHDRIVSPDHSERLYQMSFGGVAREIDLRGTTPTDPCVEFKKEITELKKRNEQILEESGKIKGENEDLKKKNNELRTNNAKLSKDLTTCVLKRNQLQIDLDKCKKGEKSIWDKILEMIKKWLGR